MNATTRRIAPALILSAVVVGAATTGSAVAAGLITGKDIMNATIASVDLKNGAVASVDVKNGTLTGKDVRPGSLQEKRLAGAVRTKLNEPSVQGYEIVTTVEQVDAGSATTVFVACTGDKIVLSGGGEFAEDAETLVVQGTAPYEYLEEGVLFAPASGDHADAWGISVHNNSITQQAVTAYALCVDPS